MQQDIEDHWIRIFRIPTQTKRRKQYRGLLPFLFIGITLFLTSCHSKDNFTVYRMETQEDNLELLYIDDVQYRRDWNGNELAMYYNGGDVWTLADGLGEQIGVCGNGADSGGGFAIYEAAGDENRAVLYTEPRKYYFGGKDVRLWLREDVSLGMPTAEMVSSITITCDKKEDAQTQTDDRILVEGLLDAYHSKSEQSVELPATDGQWISYTFILHHKNYPFLQYEISGGYSLSQNAAYCCNDELEWFVLPEEWGNMFAILLTGCSFETQTQNQDTNTSIQEGTQKMVPLETKIQLGKNTLSYGKLQITLPAGVTIEEQKPKNDTHVIDLIGAEKNENAPFPPRIWLSHYQAVYQNKWELASALLDVLPDTTLRIYDKLGDNLHYLFTYNRQNKNGYVLAYQNDICIVEEIVAESGYSFGNLLEIDAVHWEDSIQKLDVRRNNIDYADLNKIKAEKDCTLLAVQSADKEETREISLFRDGYFSALIMKLSFAECPFNIEFEDYNFDGCTDMIVPWTEIILWNTDKKKYEEVQMPRDFPIRSGAIIHYPQTRTIWGYDREYVKDASGWSSWDYYDETETLWRWEKTAIVKKRECVTEVREESVRIWAYEGNPSNMLFDETFTTKEWEQNSVRVQKRYQQFYDGMVWEEGGGKLHKIDYDQEHQEYIPRSLLDIIKKAMLDGTVSETIKKFQIDSQLTNDAVLTIAKDNLEMRSDMIWAKRLGGHYYLDMADVDNDGILDLIGNEYLNGSEGEYSLYQGQKDGTYEKTQSPSFMTKQFVILSYDGKNYLCRTFYGYDRKRNISLSCYVDGALAETVHLAFFPEKYEIRLAECAEDQYKTLAEDVLQNAVSYKEKIDKGKNINGGSEEESSFDRYGYQCDLNNDGLLEHYNKDVWTEGDLIYLHFSSEDAGIEEAVCEMEQSVEGSAVMMWAEPFAGENIINIISVTEQEGFEITGFLLNGTEYKKQYRITADVVYGVRQSCIYT